MLSTTNKNKLISTLFSIPILWMATGMLWDGDGDMRLVSIVLSLTTISLCIFKLYHVKVNFKNSVWIKLLIVSASLGGVSYLYYGFDSRELRATLVVLFILLITPCELYSRRYMQYFLFIASLCCLFYGVNFQYFKHAERGAWPINAIPFATISGMLFLISVTFLSCYYKYKSNSILILSSLLSMCGVIFSQSRGPLFFLFITLFIFIFIFFYYKSKKLAILSILFLSLIVYGLTNIPLISQRINYTYDEINIIKNDNLNTSIGIRFQMQKIAFELWQRKPFFGYGKQIKNEFDKLQEEKTITPEVNRLISMTFHNGYLDKFVLYGIPGGLIFLTFLFYPIYLSRQYSLKEGSALLWAPALFMILCNLTDAPFINAQAAIYYMFIIGAVSMMLKNEKEQRLENV